MADYYETLEIERSASQDDVKHAYFRKVRQYPPERFPDEFMELRKAYETLSDAQRRADYDIMQTGREELPDGAAELLKEAASSYKLDMKELAEKHIRDVLARFPNDPNVLKAVYSIYDRFGYSGKASDIAKRLVDIHPDNGEYRILLGLAYLNRGWNKKALIELNTAVETAPGTAVAWITILDYYAAGKMWREYDEKLAGAENHIHSFGGFTVDFYVLVCNQLIGRDADRAKEYLGKAADELSLKPDSIDKDRLEMAMIELLNSIVMERNADLLTEYKRLAEHLSFSGQAEAMKAASIVIGIESLNKRGYHPLFHDMLGTITGEDDDRESRGTIAATELFLLKGLEQYLPQLERLKTESPELYTLNSRFFDDVFEPGKRAGMKSKRENMLKKMGMKLTPRPLNDEEFIEAQAAELAGAIPLRREAVKVGRNDPCPCGSGKKYKKCCGA